MRKNVDPQLYTAWVNMKQRCYNENNPDNRYYIDIEVCNSWCEWEVFEEWAYANGYVSNADLTIDRIDNTKNYTPDNCRWVNRCIQSQNTRRLYTHNKSGQRGIFWRQDSKKWRVLIRANKERYSLGSYQTIEEAITVYNTFVIENNLQLPLNYIKDDYDNID